MTIRRLGPTHATPSIAWSARAPATVGRNAPLCVKCCVDCCGLETDLVAAVTGVVPGHAGWPSSGHGAGRSRIPTSLGRLSAWRASATCWPRPRAQIREVDTQAADEARQRPGVGRARRPRARRVRPGRPARAPSTSLAATSRARSRARSPDKATPGRRLLRRRRPLGLRGQDAAGARATPTSSRWPAASAAGRTRAATGRCRSSSPPTSATATSATSCCPRSAWQGQAKLLDTQGPAPRRRRPRLAGRALPGRGRRRHVGHRRHGRGRRLQPAAPDPPQRRPDRRAQGRLGQEDAHDAQPGRQRRGLRHPPVGRQRARPHRRLRRDHRRRRQLPEPLPAQRRVAQEAHPGRARLDLPLRGPGDGVQPVQRARATAA